MRYQLASQTSSVSALQFGHPVQSAALLVLPPVQTLQASKGMVFKESLRTWCWALLQPQDESEHWVKLQQFCTAAVKCLPPDLALLACNHSHASIQHPAQAWQPAVDKAPAVLDFSEPLAAASCGVLLSSGALPPACLAAFATAAEAFSEPLAAASCGVLLSSGALPLACCAAESTASLPPACK